MRPSHEPAGPGGPGTPRGAADRSGPTRREPPPFRRARVRATEALGPRMVRVILAGPELKGLVVHEPASSVRLLLPPDGGAGEVVIPGWDGNRFVNGDGTRPVLRTLTPRRVDPEAGELDVHVVVHGGGAASDWAVAARPGWAVAVSGPARGYAVDPAAPAHLLAGDETALPAIAQILEHLGAGSTVVVHVEVATDEAARVLDAGAGGDGRRRVEWHLALPGSPPGTALVEAVTAARVDPGTRWWVAGEAAAVQRIRRHLFDERGLSRQDATVRGYWKNGRAGEAGA